MSTSTGEHSAVQLELMRERREMNSILKTTTLEQGYLKKQTLRFDVLDGIFRVETGSIATSMWLTVFQTSPCNGPVLGAAHHTKSTNNRKSFGKDSKHSSYHTQGFLESLRQKVPFQDEAVNRWDRASTLFS